MATLSQLEVIEASELPNFGFIQITEVGEENMYFTYEGRNYCVKVEGWA